jgi:small glutamine-rich tetratricopeptide repeat-containing protein alpha|uniref:STI1/HOP DP domain-containing protein n=1 Tax=Eutreptiella gymnastica TaxID=73025 RepID=A0A7S4FPT7_9EUGL|mmetsp:Transcript_2518/g.4669  ORF Transcript_2518/g.4669 Transcript_2518/m.4669 type:complete len:406 (-) Transcript_2518:951-2168(-)
MPELVQKQVAYAILKWLKKQGSDEELDVAVQCVSQHFEVELGNAEDKNLCDTGLDLEEAVRAIVAKSGDSDAVKEQKLQEFIGILKQKGYFQGVEEGSPAYFERYEKAKQKFNARNNPYEGLTADQLKTHGNQKMVSGQYQEAVNYYTKAIEMDSSSAIYFANRAAAHTHLKDYKKAIADCESSLRIDANYSKAYSRLGTALFYEGSYQKAVEKYAKAVELDPTNEGYRADLKAAEEKLRESEAAGNPAGNAFDFSNIGSILNNPEFMSMAQNVMQQPQFADMVNQIAGNLGQGLPAGGMPDFSQMFANLAAQQPADGSIPEVVNTPFGDIKREQLESLQHMPEVRDNPKFQAIMDDVKSSGPMAMLKYMNDPEVMSTMTKLASSLFSKPAGDAAPAVEALAASE